MAAQHLKRLFVSLVFIFLVICVQQIISAPTSIGDDPHVVKFAYKAGQTYLYDFSSDSVTRLIGTSNEESRIKVKGQVLLSAKSQTEFILTVKQATFETPSGQSVSGTNAKLEGTSIGFTNENGVLKCSASIEKDDPTWSANVKRAIVSLFTNHAYSQGEFPAASYSELDVSGKNCLTYYTVTGSKYEKKRNLNTCARRDGSFSASLASVYTTDDPDAPETDEAVKSTQECVQTFDSGILQSTECTETHILRYFRNEDAAATTSVSASIKYVSVSSEAAKTPNFDTSTEAKIFFDFSNEDKDSSGIRGANAIALLKDICTEVTAYITTSEISDKYLRLKKEVAKSAEADLSKAFNGLKDGSICADKSAQDKTTKLFMLAVASAGTSDSISFFAGYYNDNSVTDERNRRGFRLYMAFAVRPKDNALAAVLKMINADSDPKLVVTAGGLGHQYCHAAADCESSSAYKDFVAAIANYASSNCLSKDPAAVEKAIAGLQSLGNLHSVTDAGEKAILKCLGGIDRVKVNALQAFRRDPCSAEAKKAANALFNNRDQPSHIRIQAYIAVSKCLKEDEALNFNDAVTNEDEVAQVKSYICSHVQNTLDSVSAGRNKEGVRAIFGNIKCPNTFYGTAFRHSKNLESSHYDAEGNSGYSAETNVIYSTDSFIPKTIEANLTVDIAGKSYNFLEFGVNSVDYEEYLLGKFGPQGTDPQNIDVALSAPMKRRSKRANPTFDPAGIEAFTKSISTKQVHEMKGVSDCYIRVYGTTIASKSFTLEDLTAMIAKTNTPTSNAERFKTAFLQNMDIADQIPLFSDELVLPTISGLPLKVTVDGSAVVSVKADSSLDADKVSFNSMFTGSATVLVRGKQTVGSGPIKSGLQLEGKLHGTHNAGVNVRVKRDDGAYSVETRFQLPTTKIRTFEYTSKLYWVESTNYGLSTKKELTYAFPKDVSATTVAVNFLPYIELSTTIQGTYPTPTPDAKTIFPNFPLNGPAEITGVLELTDPAVKELVVLFTCTDGDEKSATIVVDTPGSKVNRKIEATLKSKLGSGNTEVSASYVSAKVQASASLTDNTVGTTNDKEAKVSLNGKDYGVKMHTDLIEEEVIVSGTTETSKVSFDVSYYSPDGSGTLLKGNGERSRTTEADKISGKLMLNAETSVKDQKSGTSGSIEWEKNKKEGSYKVEMKDIQGSHSKLGTFVVNGKIGSSKTGFHTDVTTKYGATSDLNNLQLVLNLDTSKNVVADAKLVSSRRPELNFDGSYEFGSNEKSRKLLFKYNRGDTSVSVDSQFQRQTGGYEHVTDIKATYQKSKSDISWNSKFVLDGSKANMDVTLKSGADLNAVVNFDANFAGPVYNFKTQGKGYGKDFSYISSLSSSGNTRSHKVTAKIADIFDIDVSSDLQQEESKVSLVSVITSDKFFTQPITLRNELYPQTAFKNKEIKNVKKAVIQVLTGNDRTTSLTVDKATPGNVKVEVYQVGQIEATFEVGMGKGSVVMDADVNIPSSRRVISNFKVKAGSGSVDITTEVKWDANNDKTKVLSFKSSVARDGINVNSKNALDVSGEKRELNFDTKLEPALLNADHSISVDYITGSKTYSVEAEARFDVNGDTKGGKFGLKLDLPEQTPIQFKLDTQLNDIDKEKFFFDYALNYEGDISDDDSKDQSLNLKLVRKPVNGGRSLSFEGSGRLISEKPKAISLEVEVQQNEFRLKYVRKDDSKKVASIDLSASRDYSGPLNSLSAKITYDKDFTDSTPYFSAGTTYKYKFNSFKDFEVTETLDMNYEWPELGQVASSGQNYLKINENEFALTTMSKVKKPKEADFATIQDIELSGTSKDNKYSALVDIRALATLPKGLGFGSITASSYKPRFEISLEPKLPNIKVSISAQRVVLIPEFNIQLSHEESSVDGGQKRTTNVNGNVGSTAGDFTSVLEFSKTKTATDFTGKLNGDTEKKLSILIQDTANGPTAEASMKWGESENERIATKGNVAKLPNGGFDADLVFHKTPLSNQWNLKVKRNVETDQKAKFELNAVSPDTNQVVKFSLDRDINLAAKSTLKATYQIAVTKYVDGSHAGNFQIDLDTKAFDPATEKQGNQLTLDFEASKNAKIIDKSKIVVKMSDNEKRLTITSDCDRSYCIDGNALLKTSEDSGTIEIVTVRDNLKQGIQIVGSKSTDGSKYQSDVKFFFARAKAQEKLSANIYKDAGSAADIDLIQSDITAAANSISRMGIDLTFDDRTVTVVSATGNWNSPQATSCQLNVFLDKTRKPNDKFAWSFTQIPKNADNARNFLVLSKNPVVDKVFRIKTTKKLQDGDKNFDVKLELDLYKRKEDAVVLSIQRSGDDNKDVFDISCVSEGQGISFKQNCIYQAKGSDSSNLDCTMSFKSPGDEDASYKIVSDCSAQKSTAKWQQLTPEVKTYFYNAEYSESGCLKSMEYALPEFAVGDSRSIKIDKTDAPAGYTLKTFTKTEGDDYTELFVGQVVNRGLGFKLSRTDKGTTNDLVEVRRIENSTHLRSYEFIWNADQIKKSLTRIQAVEVQKSEILAKLIKNRAEHARKRITGLRETVEKARVDLDPAFNWLKDELTAIGQELGVNNDALVAQVEQLRLIAKQTRDPARESIITKSLDNIADLVASGKDTIPKLLGTVRDRIDQLGNAKNINLDEMFSKKIMALVRSSYAQFKSVNDNLQKAQEKNPTLDKAGVFVRNQVSSKISNFARDNKADVYKLFPYPEVKTAFEQVFDYITQRIATPNKRTLNDEFREMMFTKMDAGVKAILANAAFTDFQGGHAVLNIPVITQLAVLKHFLAVSRDRAGLSVLALNRNFPPPGNAIIYGTKEFKTFDGKVSPFAANCQYLLAADFANQYFTVAIDFTKKADKVEKFLYLADKKDKAIIAQDGTIFLNGKRSITGSRAGGLEVIRSGKWVGVKSDTGVTVGCQIPGGWTADEDLPCVVRISGYYHSNVNGLLGLFNNEISDDSLPSADWRLNKQCSG